MREFLFQNKSLWLMSFLRKKILCLKCLGVHFIRNLENQFNMTKKGSFVKKQKIKIGSIKRDAFCCTDMDHVTKVGEMPEF